MSEAVNIAALNAWIGRSETATDIISASALAGLAALLDYETVPWQAEAPPLAHWFSFLPQVRQSLIDRDGHPRRGGFLPPVPLPRRMWAGGRLEFRARLRIGERAERRSTIADIRHKHAASGELVFVVVRHEIIVNAVTCVVEEQDIVYRPEVAGLKPTPIRASETPPADVERAVIPDPVQLFRFSALTFNAHRIHYDRDYARDVEGYAGLVVHGPYLAVLLLDHFRRTAPGKRVTHFTFRAQRPLFDLTPFALCLNWTEDGARLWVRDASGETTMTADVKAS
jgi:3-methylfumaryl-CoA hydratase